MLSIFCVQHARKIDTNLFLDNCFEMMDSWKGIDGIERSINSIQWEAALKLAHEIGYTSHSTKTALRAAYVRLE